MMIDETDTMSEGSEDTYTEQTKKEVPSKKIIKTSTSRSTSRDKYPGVKAVAGEKVLDSGGEGNASQGGTKCFVSGWGTVFLVLFLGAMTTIVALTVKSSSCSDPVILFGQTYNPHRTTKLELSLENDGAAPVATIPTELALMTKLTHLDLSSNAFKGSIPLDLITLTALKYLNLGDCLYLEGPIPTQLLSALTDLEYLELAINGFSGTIPDALGLLTKLTYMDMMSNQLEGTIPSALSTLTHLTHLSLLDNRLEGTISAELTSLSENLQFLFLAHNDLSGSVPFDFCDAADVRIDCQDMRCVCCHSGEVGAPSCPNFEYNIGGDASGRFTNSDNGN